MGLHKRFDFSQLGGFPFTQKTLDFMQDATDSLAEVIIAIVGNNTIVSGCNKVTGLGNIQKMTAGWVVYNNELLPVKPGVWSSRLKLVEENETLTFNDGLNKEVQFSKYLIPDLYEGDISLDSLSLFYLSTQHVPTHYEKIVRNSSGGLISEYNFDCIRLSAEYVLLSGFLSISRYSQNETHLVEDLPFNFSGEVKRVGVGGTVFTITAVDETKELQVQETESFVSPAVRELFVPFSFTLKMK